MNAPLSDRSSGRVEWSEALAQARGGQSERTTNDSRTPLPVSSSPRPRLTLARLAAITDQLDDRDLAIVADVARVRMLTGGQLQRLHLGDGPSGERQARRVLARLADLDVLARLARQVGGRRAGSVGHIYSLGVAGQRLAGDRGPAGGTRRERPWTPSPLTLRHHLLVSELYVEAREAERNGVVEVLDFEAEPACWRSSMGTAGYSMVLKPDAFVRLGVGETERLHFLEMDCSTEAPSTLDRKLDRYRLYAASGIEQERWGTMPLVTWVVPDARRAEVVADACGRQPVELWPLFQVVPIGRAIDVLTGDGS